MSIKVLILTPSSGFGELIRQALEAHGDFNGILTATDDLAMGRLNSGNFDLMIIDAELGIKKVENLIKHFRDEEKNGKIMLLPNEDNEGNAVFAKIKADKVLAHPFYMPDLSEALDEMFAPKAIEKQVDVSSENEALQGSKVDQKMNEAPEWIQDAHVAAQYLMRLSLESSAQAAIISFKDQIWAYSGELSQVAAESLVGNISSHWDQGSKTDLARFVHLDETQADYMLYATRLGGDYALALVFDTKIPFSKMRQQASALAKSLSKAPEIQMAVPEAHQQGQEFSSRPISGGPFFFAGDDEFKPELPRFDHLNDQEWTLKEENIVGHKISEELRFSYVLIPRFPNHHLRGDLSRKISIWLPQMCVAYAWRLDYFEIKADFLKWTIDLASRQAPQSAAKIMAEQLSMRIFSEFPALENENPSGHFWASEALIISRDQIGIEAIEKYIRKTRAGQGIQI